jgi:glycosyltransferase involved in cell wall biosynthesis
MRQPARNQADTVRALLVSYVFPPVGGAGVARTLKLAKFLPAHGVQPTVLTCGNPSVPVFDPSLLADVPPGTEILRASTLEPAYTAKQMVWGQALGSQGSGIKGRLDLSDRFRDLRRGVTARAGALARAALVPDPQILWQPHAQLVLARRLLSARRDEVVFISGPPFSQFLLAPLARTRAAVVLDYRDEWVTYRTTYEMMGRAAAALGPALERTVLRAADAITTATEAFRDRLLADFPFLDPARVHAIPNGYDPDDFPPERPTPPGDRFVVTYAGTIFKLTSARGLLGALARLHRDEPEVARWLDVHFYGRIVDTELDSFAGSQALGVTRHGYLARGEVIRALAASHLALCLLDDVPGVERIYPAKVFELMALGRPCLTIAPEGALTRLVRAHQMGPVVAPRDEAAIASVLADAIRRFRAGTWTAESQATGLERYHRRALAGEFAAVFRAARALRAARSPH